MPSFLSSLSSLLASLSSRFADRFSSKFRTLVVVLLVALPADQLSKLVVEATLAPWDRIEIVRGFLYVTHTRNPGAVFGLFATVPEDARFIAFIFVFLLALGLIGAIYRRLAPGDRVQTLGLSSIIAGATGNFLDRAVRGEVVDFIHVRAWGGYAWPDFNLADVCIVIGVAVLVIDLLSREATERALSD